MRIVVIGAGAIGGYMAARMLEAGLDVTLLVREKRRSQLEKTGLVVLSTAGNHTSHPPLLVSGEAGGPYDLAIIATKAYGLAEILKQMKPYTHSQTVILPFLNGMQHFEQITKAYPEHPILGGVARIEATLGEDGAIHHLSAIHHFAYGKLRNLTDTQYETIKATLSAVPILVEKSNIERDLWEKYAFINVLSGLTTLFQASVGDILNTALGLETFKQAFTETYAVIQHAGGELSDGLMEKQLQIIKGLSATSTSSMLRDLIQGLPTESAHIQGYLVELAHRHNCPAPLLEIINQRLEIYENKRNRQESSS
ncbi:ketopantoate reductase family protein [Cohnella abietis]|uniref:2-dehydropantoate 2-reductase n=1 Tax=Cohnella abietis TaxID=2507935 RepID=A0A3T1DE17_9BACL|nr:ketopantoate reductase family protein [Cohnella abietis]BBI36274.1 putative oxidoreductase YkpB [Cohnella abietis]